jgi:hypothetical protein
MHNFFQMAKKDCQVQFKRLQFQPIGDLPIFNCWICINNFVNTKVEKLKAMWTVSPHESVFVHTFLRASPMVLSMWLKTVKFIV